MRADEHIAQLQESDACKYARRKFCEYFGSDTYLSYMTLVSFSDSQGGLQYRASNSFVGDYVAAHYLSSLKKWHTEFLQANKAEATKKGIKMICICELEVIGYVGGFKIESNGKSKMAKIRVAHNKPIKQSDGSWKDQTTWFNVYYSGDKRIEALGELQKGDLVRVVGELGSKRAEGTQSTDAFFVFADKVKRLARSTNPPL